MKSQVNEHLSIYDLKKFHVQTLEIDSQVLKKNPLGDKSLRHCPILVPKSKSPKAGWPVVIVLAGFSGNGPKYFGVKSFEDNFPQSVDKEVAKSAAPKAIYVFIDAWTFWGGSQFINSDGCGPYETFIVKEVVGAIRKHFPTHENEKYWCVMGGSSGGYGALHLASKYPKKFGMAAAIAPDSFFERSLLPDIYSAAPSILRYGGYKGVKEALKSGELLERRNYHSVLNAIGMAACYSGSKTSVEFPIDLKTGELNQAVWKKWLERDPIQFLKKRSQNLKQLNALFLEVGTRDQYNLQFGARQIHALLKKSRIKHHYAEFNGTHFDIAKRRPQVWQWLLKHW